MILFHTWNHHRFFVPHSMRLCAHLWKKWSYVFLSFFIKGCKCNIYSKAEETFENNQATHVMVNHKTRSGLWSFPLHATLDKIYVLNQRCHQRDAGSKGLRNYPKIIRETGYCSSTKTHRQRIILMFFTSLFSCWKI